jgi:hypothetical protein
MKVEDAFAQNRRLWVRLSEKAASAIGMPCHRNARLNLPLEGEAADAEIIIHAVRHGARNPFDKVRSE